MEKYTTKVSFEVQNSGGAPFAKFTLENYGVDYAGVVGIEGLLVEALKQMQGWGQARLEAATAQ